MNDDMNQGGDQNTGGMPADDQNQGGMDQGGMNDDQNSGMPPMAGGSEPEMGEEQRMPEMPAEPESGPDMGEPAAGADMGGDAPTGGEPEEHHDENSGQM